MLTPSAGRNEIRLQRSRGERSVRRALELERGESVVLRTAYEVDRVSVGDPEVADVVVLSPREVQVVAREIGDTNVLLWGSGQRLETALAVTIGTPYSKIERELQRVLGTTQISVDGAGESVVLKGHAPSPTDVEVARRVASAFFPDDPEKKVINLIEVGGDQQVMLEVIVAEMSRSLGRRLGSNFHYFNEGGSTDFEIFNFLQNLTSLDESLQDDLIRLTSRVNLVSTITQGNDFLRLFVEAIQDRGLAKVLAEPSLVARSGEPAKFLVGGEVPIPVPQSGAIGVITIQFKEFGVGVTFTPTVLGPDRIHLQVAPEVSEPDLTLGAQVSGFVVPAFNTRKASTGIELADGQSFAIAGLLSERVRALTTKYPVLGDIPVLGGLFSSNQWESEQTELVILVTPRIVKPLPPGRPPLPTDHYIEPNMAEFYLLGAIEGDVLGRWGITEPKTGGNTDVSTGPSGPWGHRIDVRHAEEDIR